MVVEFGELLLVEMELGMMHAHRHDGGYLQPASLEAPMASRSPDVDRDTLMPW